MGRCTTQAREALHALHRRGIITPIGSTHGGRPPVGIVWRHRSLRSSQCEGGEPEGLIDVGGEVARPNVLVGDCEWNDVPDGARLAAAVVYDAYDLAGARSRD
jgi:hypothetical protein